MTIETFLHAFTFALKAENDLLVLTLTYVSYVTEFMKKCLWA